MILVFFLFWFLVFLFGWLGFVFVDEILRFLPEKKKKKRKTRFNCEAQDTAMASEAD